MKRNIYDEYVDKVLDLFNLKKKYLFTKSKRRDIVDSRHMLHTRVYGRQRLRGGSLVNYSRDSSS